MMRVVIVSDFGDVTGGAAKVAITSARGLADRGLTIVFVCATGPISELLYHPNIDLRCLDLPEVWSRRNPLSGALQGIWNSSAARLFREILRKQNPNETIVHFHQWTKAFSPSVIAAARALRFPCVFTLHDYFLCCPNGTYFHFGQQEPCTLTPLSPSCVVAKCDSRNYAFKMVRLVRQLGLDWALHRAQPSSLNVIHVSSFAASVAMPLLPAGARHFTVPNPVDVEKRPPALVRDNAEFVFVGRFTKEKECAELARAALLTGAPVTFVGQGYMEAAIRCANPRARILPWSSASEVEQILLRARALVFPSAWYETSGLVVAEALARGVPAIVSRNTGAADIIRDGVNGLLCTAGDLEDLIASIQCMQDGDTAEAMGKRAYEIFWKDPSSVSAHVARLLATYRCLRGRKFSQSE